MVLYGAGLWAARTGIPQHHLSEMENGTRPIGKKRARKLAEALGVGDWRVLVSYVRCLKPTVQLCPLYF